MFEHLLAWTAIAAMSLYSLFIFFREERSVVNSLLPAALIITALLHVFDTIAILLPGQFFLWKRLALISESLLPLCWLLFTLVFARQVGELRDISLIQKSFLCASLLFIPAVFAFPLVDFFISPDFTEERMLFLGNPGVFFYTGILVFMILSLINLETTLLTTSGTSRWKIKFEILGTGVLLAAFVFYYSQGLLYRSINMNLLPVRSVVMIISVALMAYSRLRRGTGVKVYVSRKMAYRSLVIFFAGLYLIGISLLGEGMRYFGRPSQDVVVISLAFIGALCLIALFLSDTATRKMKVFLHKHFYSQKYDYRVQWLQFTDRLSTSKSRDEVLRAILTGFSETFGMSRAVLFLSDPEGGTFTPAAAVGADMTGMSVKTDDPVIHLMRNKRWIVDLSADTPSAGGETRDALLKRNGRFIVPLFFVDEVAGFIVLGGPINQEEVYIYEDYDLMKTLAGQASSAILNLRLSEDLLKAREMEAIGKVSAFVLHDLKNLVSTISLILENAHDYIDLPDFQRDMLQSLGSTVEKMKRLIARLKIVHEKQTLSIERTDLAEIVRRTSSLIPTGSFVIAGQPVYANVDREEIEKVVLNLLINAQEASNGKPVIVETGSADMAYIRVSDRGCGMSAEFLRNHLFKPFRTTKGKGLGIGLYQSRQIAEAHSGKIDVMSTEGEGSAFTLYLPLTDGSAAGDETAVPAEM